MKDVEYKYSFEKLNVWQNSRVLAKKVYQITSEFPKEEQFCLTNQLRRAVISISSNIAEGSSRISLKDQAHFTNLAYSSLMEVLNQFYLALDLGFIEEFTLSELRNKINEISIQLNSLRNSQINR